MFDDVNADKQGRLAKFGGFVIGVPWSADMMETDGDGFVNYSGPIEGGHCVVTKGWSDRVRHNGRVVRAARGKQSWGDDWGEGGFFWIEEHDLEKFLADDGEFCLPVEVKVQPLKKAGE